jgi:hypothetical protein
MVGMMLGFTEISGKLLGRGVIDGVTDSTVLGVALEATGSFDGTSLVVMEGDKDGA